jgi:AcrR family transcriptional regulator
MKELPPVYADRRVQRSKDLVLAETYKLLSEGGIGGVSIDEVSRRSGVSKTTIYRHWPSRSALLLDACSKIGNEPVAPDTGSLKGDLSALLGDLAHELQTARWTSVVPSIIDAAERDSELAKLHATIQASFRKPFMAVIERWKKNGDLKASQDTSEVVASILGPFFYRRWFSGEKMDNRFVKTILCNVTGQTTTNK